MMDCTHYRRAILADPNHANPGPLEHRASCHDCQDYTVRVLRFESRLQRALCVTVPERLGSAADADRDQASDRVVPLHTGLPGSAGRHATTSEPAGRPGADDRGERRIYRRGWLAMAASVLMAVVVAGALWLAVPGRTLAADVVTHIVGEPQAWRQTDVSVPDAALLAVLRDAHVRLGSGAGRVSYASSCRFRGHQVPHLVLLTESGPVTVMVLAHEPLSKSTQFDEQGYRGVIVPVSGHGSLAVLARGQNADIAAVQRVAARVLDSISWTL